MPLRRFRFLLSTGSALAASLLASAPAAAVGLGPGDPAAVLGQPLNYGIALRLDPGEPITPECVSAEVMFGERRVPPPLVGVRIEPTSPQTARLRILTQPAVDEPVLTLVVSAGCSNRITRRYVVLADPPGLPPPAPAVPPAFAVQPALVPDAPATPGLAPPPLPPAAGGAAPIEAPAVAPPPAAAPAPTPEQIAEREQRRAQQRAERQARLARQRAARERAAREREAREAQAQAAGTPRLQLDVLEPPVAQSSRGSSAEAEAVAQAMAAIASAASAAREAAAAASAQAARIAELEKELAAVREQAEANRELAAQLRLNLAEAQRGNRWTTPLALLSLLLAVLAAWLAWRLGRVQAQQRAQWQQAVAVPGPETSATAMGMDAVTSREATSPAPFVTGRAPAPGAEPRAFPATTPPVAAARARVGPAWPPPARAVDWPPPPSTLPPPVARDDLERSGTATLPLSAAGPDTEATTRIEPPTQRTETLPGGGRGSETSPRDVSIEELLDLEQQAEFFMVLGQDEAAVDLLVDHLRSTGGGSPLPYLKLLEIHQRRDDREAYERMRQRFNHRFNAYAPEWGADMTAGRSLEDYPGVLPRLQAVWARPLDAMAELEALLFRKSRGELFDLPAYREVLFLYAMARDLLDRAAADTGSVDLLLPMNDGGEFGSTEPTPYLGLDRDAFKDTQPPEDMHPTAPLDFDLTSERPTSIFDLLDGDKKKP